MKKQRDLMRKQIGFALVLGAMGIACDQAEVSRGALTAPSPDQGAAVAEGKGTLQIESTETEAKGTFALGDRHLSFHGRTLPGDKVDITVDLGDLMLSAVGEASGRSLQLDGFATANGEDTQITDADRTFMAAFTKSVQRDFTARPKGTAGMEDRILRLSSAWSQWSDGLDLAMPVLGEKDRTSQSLCTHMWAWVRATHDCWDYDRWDDKSSAWISVGTAGSAFPDGQYTHHYYNSRRSWGSAQAHKAGSSMIGSCMGRCGAGCADPGDVSVLSQDCADHDVCVTGNHGVSSFWCSDEFADTVDDYTLGSTCEATAVPDPGFINTWILNGFPNQAPY